MAYTACFSVLFVRFMTTFFQQLTDSKAAAPAQGASIAHPCYILAGKSGGLRFRQGLNSFLLVARSASRPKLFIVKVIRERYLPHVVKAQHAGCPMPKVPACAAVGRRRVDSERRDVPVGAAQVAAAAA